MALTVSYTQIGKARKEDSNYMHRVMKVEFGDGVETYATGVELDKNKLGCPNYIVSLNIMGAVDGFVYKYDFVNNKINIFQVPAVVDTDPAAPLAELDASDTPAAVDLYVEVVGY